MAQPRLARQRAPGHNLGLGRESLYSPGPRHGLKTCLVYVVHSIQSDGYASISGDQNHQVGTLGTLAFLFLTLHHNQRDETPMAT
jgi:hypothetical protein